jgi:hypothetical protein
MFLREEGRSSLEFDLEISKVWTINDFTQELSSNSLEIHLFDEAH